MSEIRVQLPKSRNKPSLVLYSSSFATSQADLTKYHAVSWKDKLFRFTFNFICSKDNFI